MRLTLTTLLLPFLVSTSFQNPFTSEPLPTLHVFDFELFVNSTADVPSHVFLRVMDLVPEHQRMKTFNDPYPRPVVRTRESSGDIFGLYKMCSWNLAFKIQEDYLAFWYAWLGPKDEQTRTCLIYEAFTEEQPTYWSAAQIESGGNVTTKPMGTYYDQTVKWEFPVKYRSRELPEFPMKFYNGWSE